MIKKLKLSLLIAVLSLAVGVSQAFATSDLTFSVNTNLTLGSHNYTILSGSEATSIVVAADGLSADIIVPTGANLTIVSPNRDTLTTTGGTTTCTNSESTLVIAGSASTRTFTPSTTACGVITSGNGAGGGGGGGGSSVVVTATTTTPTTTTISGCTGTTGFSTVTGLSCSGNTTTVTTTTPVAIAGCTGTSGFSTVSGVSCATNGTTVSTTTSYNLGTTTLRNGSKGAAVVQLQKILNKILKLGLVEDGKLGPKTIAVIKKWQKAHGLVVDGLVGKLTKAAMIAEAEKE